jgi:hypothetical protein
MFLTAHTSAAILIAAKIHNPILAIILGFLSHFVLDAIPHGEGDFFSDPKKTKKQQLLLLAKVAILDLLLASIFLASFLYISQPDKMWVFVLTALASWLPDLTWGAIEVLKLKFIYWFLRLHHKAHDLFDIVYPIKYGLVFQLGFIILMLSLTALL